MENHHWAGLVFFIIIIMVLIYLFVGSGVSTDNLACRTINAKCMSVCDDPYTVHNVVLDDTCSKNNICCMKSIGG